MQEAVKRILIVTAVDAEKEAVARGLHGANRFDVLAAGAGPTAAAVSTAAYLAKSDNRYMAVISTGIGGGFSGQAEVGELVVASEIIAADLGAQTAEGFVSLDTLGFGFTRIKADNRLSVQIAGALRAAGLTVHIGPVLTLSTVTGTAATATELAARVPGAAAEAMEGFGVASAALSFGLPVLEIRAISNKVGPRDRDAWRIGDALRALESASSVLMEVMR